MAERQARGRAAAACRCRALHRRRSADARVLALAVVYFGAVATNYGISFWLPQIVKDFGNLSNLQIGVITAIPYAIGLVGMVWWSRRSDEKFERKGHAAIALAVAGIFIG